MAKLFGEIDLNNRIRAIQKKGFKTSSIETQLSQIQTANLIASITESSIMDRIYVMPKLNPKQMKVAVQQKIKKDLEFIADINEVEWIYSAFKEKNNYRVLVSIIKREQLSTLPEFKALTTTSQVIASFLNQKLKENFLLVHSFFDDYIIFVFKNGYIDYIRGFKTENPIGESIELTLEYYKEQHKIEIKNIVYSGDVQLSSQPNRNVLPISEFINNIPDIKFFVPHILPLTKPSFLYKKKTFKPIYATIPLSVIFFLSGAAAYMKTAKVENQISQINSRIERLNKLIGEKQQEISELTKTEESLKKSLSSPEIKTLLSVKKPEIYSFITSLTEPLKLSKSYILKLSGNGEEFTLSTITFCSNIEKPEEFHSLLSFLKGNKYIEYFKLLSVQKLMGKRAIMAVFKIKLRAESYAKT